MNALRDNRGQTIVLTVVFLTGLLAMTAFVLDVGSWYRAQRAAQATADAAALAAAHALPHDRFEAKAVAMEYGDKNGGGVASVTFSTKYVSDDTVSVEVKRSAPGLFAKIFDIDSVAIGARASARAVAPQAAQWVAPIVVYYKHPLLWSGGKAAPKYGVDTDIKLSHLHKPGSGDAAGSFGLIDLVGKKGSVGTDELAEWMARGFEGKLPIESDYDAVPSVKFNSGQFKSALGSRLGEEILLPVYTVITGPGSGAQYHIIGFVGFKVASFHGGGETGEVKGQFTRYIAQGIQATSSSADPNSFGTRIISLVE